MNFRVRSKELGACRRKFNCKLPLDTCVDELCPKWPLIKYLQTRGSTNLGRKIIKEKGAAEACFINSVKECILVDWIATVCVWRAAPAVSRLCV